MDRPESSLSLALQAAPLVVSAGTGEPAFAAIYLALLGIARGAEASPAAALAFSTLIFAATSTLTDGVSSSPLLCVAANGLLASALIWTEVRASAQQTLAPEEESDPFASFDRRLRESTQARPRGRSRPPRLMAGASEDPARKSDEPALEGGLEVGGATTPRTFDFTGMGDAFEGSRVLDLRKRELERETRRRSVTAATVLGNLRDNPGTAILILLFGLLTAGDFVFNVSRQFICVLPELCAPASSDL